MAKINTIFSFKDEVSDGLRRVRNEAELTSGGFSKLVTNLLGVSSAMQIVGMVKGQFDKLTSAVNECVQVYQYQAEQELKLETIMRQRMNATDAEIQSVKDLASAQQRLGIYGDEMILQGAQELASFTSSKEAIETLIPAMNNLIAQQYGLSASGQNFQMTADMMGKVLSGQTGALSRMGYIFSEEEKQLLKTGNEMERASTLAKIITDNVGNMNEALRNTDMGNIQAMNNQIGDLKEQLGQALIPFQSMFTLATGEWKIKFYKTLINALNFINKHPIVKALLKGLIVGAITSIVVCLSSTLVPMLTTIIAKLTIIQSLAGPLSWITLAVGGITAGVIALSDSMGSATQEGKELARVMNEVGMNWKEAEKELFNGQDGLGQKQLNAYKVGIAKAEDEINRIYKSHYTLKNIDWKKQGIIDPDDLLQRDELDYIIQVKKQYEDFIKKHDDLLLRMDAEAGLLRKQKELTDKINESNEKYKNTLEKIHDEYSKTNFAQNKQLEEQLKEYEEIYRLGYMMTAKAGPNAGSIVWENKMLTSEQKGELKIVIDELRDKLKTKGGALRVRDDALLSIADDYRDLLSKRATERFNLQYKSVTPSVNINKMEVNNGTDAETVKNEIVAGLIEAQNASLTGA